MKEIPLTKGFVAFVSSKDFRRMAKYKWHAEVHGQCVYAARNVQHGARRGKIYMHREITCATRGVVTDHRNNQGCDNTRKNLRLCSRQQNNQAMRRKSPICSSSFRGVGWDKSKNKWQVRVAGRFVGRFDSELAAAAAYNTAARKQFGRFAQLNSLCSVSTKSHREHACNLLRH